MYVDDVAVDFPELTIVLAHPSFPWQDEAISVALHKQQVYIDLSGWSPKYFPPQLVQYANTLLRDRVLFGSDYPLITPDRWLEDFARADFRDEVRPLDPQAERRPAAGAGGVAPRRRAPRVLSTTPAVASPIAGSSPRGKKSMIAMRISPNTPNENTVGAASGRSQPKQVRPRAQVTELLLEVEDGHRPDHGAVDVAEPADGDHDDELRC